jgi:hypothetical protein
VRKLFGVIVTVALVTFGGLAFGAAQHHDLGQIVADGESGGGD